jgi:hypothetical protein
LNAALKFWGAALAVALLFALAAALFLPYRSLGLLTEADRWRAWLLTLWTGGVLCILFGITTLLGYGRSIGFRDVAEAGSVPDAIEAQKKVRKTAADLADFHGNFAWWIVSTGVLIILVYFAGWSILRS